MFIVFLSLNNVKLTIFEKGVYLEVMQ